MRLTAWKPIEHPPVGLTCEPIADVLVHKLIREVFAAGKDRLGEFSESGSIFYLLAEQSPSAQVSESVSGSQSPSLSALAGSRRT